MKRTRIVVTGVGIVSPLGCGRETFWSALCRGDCAIRPLTALDTTGFALTRGGEVLDAPQVPELDTDDRATQFMAAAAREAWDDAGVVDGASVGMVLSTNFGSIGSAEPWLSLTADGSESLATAFGQASFQDSADRVARVLGVDGARSVLSLSCASGTAALSLAASWIRAGRASAVLAGGFDALSRFAWSGLSALRTMTKGDVRPCDVDRDGTLFSEGAGAVLLEAAECAHARGAAAYAELLGTGTNNNAFHLTAPAKEGAGSARVMRMALADAGMDPGEVDHINLHGTGTRHNDVTETQAVKAVFGEAACRIPVTAIKSMTGHMMGAAGSVEAIASILTLRDGVIPPTLHLQNQDPECDLDVVANAARPCDVRAVLSNSAGIGGCNAAAIFGKVAAS